MTAALELTGVGFAYRRQSVLHGVDLTVPHGSFTAIIGPNGGGKSTLLKLALGLLEPDQGTVRLLGDRPRDARRRVGYLPQSSHLDLDFPITAGEVVSHGRLGHGFQFGPFRRDDRRAAPAALTARAHAGGHGAASGRHPFAAHPVRAAVLRAHRLRRAGSASGHGRQPAAAPRRARLAALQETECADLARRSLSNLSGGQRQRVLIARALATEPEMLVLDEPSAGLDPASQTDLYNLLSRLAKRLTIIVVSHHVSLVSRHVNQVVCIHDGHLHMPTTAEIGPDLANFFPDMVNMVLVRHEHDHCPLPEEPHHD